MRARGRVSAVAARRTRRASAAASCAVALATALSGCVTVHGENAVIPALSKAEAAKAVAHFTSVSNKSNRTYDPKLNSTVETGALGAIDQAGLKARRKVQPGGAKNYQPLKLTDTRFLVPEQAGWPKFFVADTRSNRSAGSRWLLVFQRSDPDDAWKASYLSIMQPSEMPDFATDGHGHVKAVPTSGGSGLTVAPDELSREYVRYLGSGKGDFAPGKHTSGRRASRERSANRPGRRTEFADQTAQAPQYPPFGLRTKDGGALVFFASQHLTKETYAEGYHPPVKDPLLKALLTGKPDQAVTYRRLSEQAVTVPAKKASGKIEFVNRIDGLINAKGE